jgi:hypothetical protein
MKNGCFILFLVAFRRDSVKRRREVKRSTLACHEDHLKKILMGVGFVDRGLHSRKISRHS